MEKRHSFFLVRPLDLILNFFLFHYHLLTGKVRSGLPALSLPPFSAQVGNQTYSFMDMCSQLGSGIIVLPLVAVLANVSIAKAFGK